MENTVVALGLAALWATVSEHSFRHDLYITTLVIGGFLLVMGAVDPAARSSTRAWTSAAPSRPGAGFPASSRHLERWGEDPTLGLGIIFVLTGLALLAFATIRGSVAGRHATRARCAQVARISAT